MEENNKLNTLYFESSTMKGLYDTIENWQVENQKRLLSLNIQKNGDNFCCIALTNPTEVVITSLDGKNHAELSNGNLCVLASKTWPTG